MNSVLISDNIDKSGTVFTCLGRFFNQGVFEGLIRRDGSCFSSDKLDLGPLGELINLWGEGWIEASFLEKEIKGLKEELGNANSINSQLSKECNDLGAINKVLIAEKSELMATVGRLTETFEKAAEKTKTPLEANNNTSALKEECAALIAKLHQFCDKL